MKLKNKLFLNFGTLFFLTINIFGVLLIQSNFDQVIMNTVNSSLGEYSVLYTNFESAKNIGNIFITNKDMIKVKADTYLKNINNPNITLEFKTLKNEVIYNTKELGITYPESIYDIQNNSSNYMIYKNDNNKLILINSVVTINENKYHFTYINNLEHLYTDRNNSFITLLKLNVIIGIILLLIIYLISVEITRPINRLIGSMDEIIKGKYIKKFEYKSNITEINSISNNFSHMNEDIQNNIQDLKNQNNIKQRFIDNLTHEIRTPLTSIIGYSDLMIKKNINDPNLTYKSFQNINREGKRILSLSSNLVTLITLDKKSLNLCKVNLMEVLQEIANRYKIKFNDLDINLKIYGENFEIISDKELLSILISNFVDNAIKATIERDIRDVSLELDKNTIMIKDTGKGISKEDINKIFEPFYMVDKSRSKSIEGFGLGLSICKEISDILDIKIDIKSELEDGTEITLIFKEIIK